MKCCGLLFRDLLMQFLKMTPYVTDYLNNPNLNTNITSCFKLEGNIFQWFDGDNKYCLHNHISIHYISLIRIKHNNMNN
jgi:hypothetical protein